MRKLKKGLKVLAALAAVILPLVLTAIAMAPTTSKGDLERDSSGLTKVSVQIDGAATPYYAPLYLAQEKGYFADEGLDVEFYYASAAEIVKNVAAENVTFGFPNSDTVVMGRANNVPVKIIHTTYQSSLGSIIYKTSSGMSSLKDLRGKTIAVTSFGSPNYIQLQVALQKAGLTTDDVNIKIIGTGGIVNALATDQVDAICFSMLRAYDLEAQGVDVGEFRAEDYLPGQGNVVITSDAFLQNHRDVCEAFTRALNRSLDFILDGNVRPAIDLAIEKYAPASAGSEERIEHVMEQEFVPKLWQSENTGAHGLGWSDADRYQNYIDILASYGIIENSYPSPELFVNLMEVKQDEHE